MDINEYAYLIGYLSGAIKGAIKSIDSGVPQLIGFDGLTADLQRALDEITRVDKKGIHEVSHARIDKT